MIARLALATVAAFATGNALAVCTFDGGTISNPNDPACRDAQLEYTENEDGADKVALGYPVPVPEDSLTAFDGFRTYGSLHARHQELLMSAPSVSGEIVGRTLAGRPVWAYVLGDADRLTADGRPEGAVIVNGGIHAREWQSPEVLTETFEQLVELADDTNLGQYLHDNLSVVLLPVLNIDGLLQTQRFPSQVTADVRQPRDGRMRRKNMNHPSADIVDEDIFATADNFFGVDLNRNNQHGFGLNNGSSANTISLVYHGLSAGSEPEIRALRTATELGPANRLRLGIDVHSFTRVYFTPLTGNARRDLITRDLAARMRAVTGFKYRYAPDLPGSRGIGTVADYFAYEFQIPSWTLETEPLNGGQDYDGTGASHSGFILPDSEIARVRDELAATLLLGFFRQSGPPHLVSVRITEADTGATVYGADWVADGSVRRLQTSSDRALVPGSSYRLWAAFSKPMRWLDAEGALGQFAGQNASAEAVRFSSADAGETFGFEVPVPDGAWLATAGGAPDGYLTYAGDAFATEFTVPAAIGDALSGPAAVSLQFEATDIAQLALDGDPRTIVDWSGGHWTGYTDSALANHTDTGGADCTHVTFVAAAADAAAPDKTTECPAFAATKAAPPPPPAPAPPPQGGGGGAPLWLLPAAVAGIARCRRRD